MRSIELIELFDAENTVSDYNRPLHLKRPVERRHMTRQLCRSYSIDATALLVSVREASIPKELTL
jgi:hypothetical protein